MPRPALKIEGAPNKTRWTLAKSNDTTPVRPDFFHGHERDEVYEFKMQVPPQQHHGGQQQPNGLYFNDEQQLPRYSYDGSQYSSPSARVSSQGPWPAPTPQQMNNLNSRYDNNYVGFDFNMTESYDGRPVSNRISVNTGVRPVSRRGDQDSVSQHLLYETALLDSQTFEILDIAEVDALKKEHVRLNQKIDATQRKLALESKVRDAAQNLQRLYSTKNRPDTPQDSPDSAKKGRGSLLGRGSRESSSSFEHLQQADNELAASVKKVDQLHQAVKEFMDRRQVVESSLLRHTAAVLAEEANRVAESAVPGLTNGHHGSPFGGDESAHTPNEFDGIRDILHGMPAGASSKVKQHEEQLNSIQERLEQFNNQLRNVVSEASQTVGKLIPAEMPLDQSEDSSVRLDERFARLENNLHTLEQTQQEVKAHYARIQEDQYATNNAMEEQMHDLNKQLQGVLLVAAGSQPSSELQEPPSPDGHGYHGQVRYMEDSLATMDQLLQNQQQHSVGAAQNLAEHENQISGLVQQLDEHRTRSEGLSRELEQHQGTISELSQKVSEHEVTNLDLSQKLSEHERTIAGFEEQISARDNAVASLSQKMPEYDATISSLSQKLSDYETTISGLWEIMQPDTPSRRPIAYDEEGEIPPAPISPLRESFSLPAFSALVQNLYDRAQSAKEQQDILRRQIQQQRELNGKSDAEKDRELSQWQEKHTALAQEHGQVQSELAALQQELANWMVKHESTANEAEQSRGELENVMNELEEMRKTMEAKQAERDEVIRKMREQLDAMETQMQSHADAQQEIENLESEVVRLTMDLTNAKAELDSAYGSRQQRKGEQAAELEALTEKNRAMVEQSAQWERELREMTSEFQELTRESIELEKEREGLEAMIEQLRERCEGLEAVLAEERLRWVGVKSPTGVVNGSGSGEVREATSMMVLRQEFKKMMREQRAEGLRLLKAEQEERRKLEAEVRKLRQAGGPLGKRLESASGTVTPM